VQALRKVLGKETFVPRRQSLQSMFKEALNNKCFKQSQQLSFKGTLAHFCESKPRCVTVPRSTQERLSKYCNKICLLNTKVASNCVSCRLMIKRCQAMLQKYTKRPTVSC